MLSAAITGLRIHGGGINISDLSEDHICGHVNLICIKCFKKRKKRGVVAKVRISVLATDAIRRVSKGNPDPSPLMGGRMAWLGGC